MYDALPEIGPLTRQLVNTHWRLVHVDRNGRVTHTAGLAWLNFSERTLSGGDGCNSLHGVYKASPDGFLVLDYAITLMACQITNAETGEVWENDDLSLPVLGDVFAYRLDGDELQLLFRAGDESVPGLLLFRRA